MNLITLIFLCICLAIFALLVRLWLRLPIPSFSRNMLTLSLLFAIPGIVLTLTGNVWGPSLIAIGGLLSTIESYVRRRKDKTIE